MPNPLQQAGAQSDKPMHLVPIYTNEWWTGLWTNRSLLRDAATAFLVGKFYSGSRYESLLGGQNVEITPRLTPARRPGNSVYNSNSFPAINDFFSFHVFNAESGIPVEGIRVVADSAATVYDVTAGIKLPIFSKTSGAGQMFFQDVGNTLYMGDGIDLEKWVWAPGWTPSTFLPLQNTTIIDSNQNLQQLIGQNQLVITNIAIASNVLTITTVSNTLPVGTNLILADIATATFLNGTPITLLTSGVSSITAEVPFQTYTSAADTGWGYITTAGLLTTTGPTTPSWGMTPGSLTVDNIHALWLNVGPSVQQWGIDPPLAAPMVSNVPSNAFQSWAASTFYNPSELLFDPNSNIQLLTTAGTTASSVPTFAGSGTTTDGTAVWTFQGQAARQTSHAYTTGQFIRVAVTQTSRQVIGFNPVTKQLIYGNVTTTVGIYFYQCTTAGTSGVTTDANLKFPSGVGATFTEPGTTLVWTNVGQSVTRASANAIAVIGNSTVLSLTTSIADSNGNLETISIPGLTGSTAPTWTTTSGATTVDHFASWLEGGPATSAGTGPWLYAFAYKNSVTGHVSTASPASVAITLAQQSFISVSGPGDANYLTDGVDIIEIYRTTQGQSTLFFIADIPAPLGGAGWNYIDSSPDPGINVNSVTGGVTYTNSPQSTMNIFIEADVTGTNAPPPAGALPQAYHLNRVFVSNGEIVNYSLAPGAAIGVGAESFPGENFWQMPSTVTKCWPSTLGLLIFCVQGVFVSPGVDSNGNPLDPVPLLSDVGLLSPNYFTINGSIPGLYTSDQQFITLDPSAGLTRTGFPIEDTLAATFTSTAGYLTWHTSGSDQGYYIADGSTGWYRCNPTPAPEASGNTWSLKANIVGGVKCVKSIEISPGVKRLLSGPGQAGGPILQRDYTTYQDNGASYPANFIVGNIVLAQPSQAANVAYITTEALAIGSRPSVSILAGEVSGTFETLQKNEPDPPYLVASLTIYSDRWYFDQLKTPAWLRHMQLNFSWPQENFANELLTYTIVGAMEIEAS